MRILYLFLSIVVVWSCQSQQSSGELPPEAFQQAINEDEEAIVIDVRTAGELSRGIIEGAVHMDIKSSDFKDRAARLDKNKPYYVYCLSGARSAQAAQYFESIGIENAVNLEGGLLAWQKAGLPIVGENAAEDKISGEQYGQLVNSNKKVLVDFYAPWCAPCVRMEPMLDEVQKERQDELKILRVNIEENKRLAKALGVSDIPVFKYYVSGDEKWEHRGELKKDQLMSKIGS